VGTRAGDPGWGSTDYSVPAEAAKWLERANEAMSVVAMIETCTGYRNAEAIVSTPGVDMLYVGPYDFSISMGFPGDYDHPRVRGPMEEILAICQAHKVAFGTTASGLKGAERWIELGARFFEASDELTFIRDGATQLVADYGRLIQEHRATL
jgi:2-keto-3-deoxy-L-rhamnonate aldolase RhmA